MPPTDGPTSSIDVSVTWERAACKDSPIADRLLLAAMVVVVVLLVVGG